MPNESYYKSQHWQNLRKRVLRRDGYQCCDCKRLALGKNRNGLSPVVDHIKPRAKVPHPTMLDTPGNCITRCHPCHTRKTHHVDLNDKPAVGADGLPASGEWS